MQQLNHLHLHRPRVPERCRRSPDSSYDRTFGLHICNVSVKEGSCFFRGPVTLLEANGQKFECRKAGGEQ